MASELAPKKYIIEEKLSSI